MLSAPSRMTIVILFFFFFKVDVFFKSLGVEHGVRTEWRSGNSGGEISLGPSQGGQLFRVKRESANLQAPALCLSHLHENPLPPEAL